MNILTALPMNLFFSFDILTFWNRDEFYLNFFCVCNVEFVLSITEEPFFLFQKVYMSTF